MRKPTICICENNRAFVFATRIVQFLFYLYPKFQASSSFLCLYKSVCVGPVRKPHCWFSHETAHFLYICFQTIVGTRYRGGSEVEVVVTSTVATLLVTNFVPF